MDQDQLPRDAKEIVAAFVAVVNGGHAEKVAAAMGANPLFIDSSAPGSRAGRR